jgi:shikimate kinase
MESVRNIVLTGFMATGKTTVGQLVADFISWQFVDMDDEITERIGLPIPDIFAHHGEEGFRRYERIICQSLAARSEQVIATGGGALIDPASRALMMMSGLVICLTAAPDAIRERLVDPGGRPLARQWESLLEQRAPIYAQFPLQIDTTDLSVEQVAQKVVALWSASR